MPRQAQMLTLSDEGASLSMEPFSMTLSPLDVPDVVDNPDAQFAITAGTDSFLTQELKSINPNVTSVITEIVSISDAAPLTRRRRKLQDSSSTVVQLGGTVHVDSEPVPTSNQLNAILNEALADTTFLVRNITSVGVPALSNLEEIGVQPLEIADTPSPTTTPATAAPTVTPAQDKVIAGANQDLSSSNQDEKSTLEMVYPAVIVAVAVFVLTALVIVVRRNRSAQQVVMAKDAASTSDSEGDIEVAPEDPHQQQLMEDGQTMIHMPAQYQIQGATTKQNNNDPEYDPRDRSMVPPMILRMASSLEDDASYADQSAFHQYPARTPTPTTHHFNDGNYDEFRET